MKSKLISALLGLVPTLFSVERQQHRYGTPSREARRHQRGGKTVKSVFNPMTHRPGAKLAKKALKGTVGLRHGAPFGQK